MKRTVFAILAYGFVFASLTSAAFADGPQGVWIRSEGTAKVKFGPCGDSLCGVVVWLKNTGGPGKIGEQVFFDMKPAGANKWTGSAFNPEDGRTYDGKMELSGNRLVTTGCALGGMICRSVNWTRTN
jgi:uncharacterized protein (DUF2147 family)